MTKRVCTACGSPDLVSYWQKQDTSAPSALLKAIYTNAERCVDCNQVMPHGGCDPDAGPLELAKLQKAATP